MGMGWIRASLLLVLLFAVLDCRSQVQPVLVRVDATGETSAVQLSLLDVDSESAAKFFRSPADQAFRPYSLWLMNNSGKKIVGLSLIWTIATPEVVHRHECHFETSFIGGFSGMMLMPVRPTPEDLAARRAARRAAIREQASSSGGAAAEPRVQVSRSDASSPFVLAPGARVVIAPDRFTFPNGASGGSPAEMKNATDVSVLVDAVVFADGLVLGPDQTGTLEALNARNAAFEALLVAVRSAKEKGEDPIPLLEQLSEDRLRSRDATARAQGMMANILLHSSDWEKQFKSMETTELVNYHR